MRVAAVALLISLFFLLPVAEAQGKPSPVVIELFTSEGCSSCPPADRLLAKLQAQHSLNGTELILLGEHVDYWDELGWHDRFSQHVFTERQQAYAQLMRSDSPYTPQAVVNGTTQVLGNDEAALLHAIDAGKSAVQPADVRLQWHGKELQVSVKGTKTNATVLLFVTEDDLTTEVRTGENRGTTLNHAAVVREILPLGETKGGTLQQSLRITRNQQWQAQKLRFIVVAQQQHGSGAIEGAAAITMPD